MNRLKTLFAGLVIPALVAGMTTLPASAQTASNTPAQGTTSAPSVGVAPVGTNPNDPNSGQWFVAAATPTSSGFAPIRMTAHISNPSDAPLTVKLYLEDLDFANDGTPQVAATSKDIGTWGGFDQPLVTVPAKQSVDESFTVIPPRGADPGDHTGVVVAESAPQATPGQLLKIVSRVATRLYVTIPGDAQPAMTIQQITLSRDSSFFPRQMTVRVLVRNTGRVRLQPTVKVNGHKADGSTLLMSNSVEAYLASVKVPFFGGPLSYHVQVTSQMASGGASQSGPAQDAHVSTFVFPWILLVLLALAALVFLAGRWLLRKRGGKYAAIQADLRRMEKLLSQERAQATMPVPPVPAAEPAPTPPPSEPEPAAAPPAPVAQAPVARTPEPAPDPEPAGAGDGATRWGDLVDTMRTRSGGSPEFVDDDGPVRGKHFADTPPEPGPDDDGVPSEHDADVAIRAAAKQARRVGDEATASRLEESLRGWS